MTQLAAMIALFALSSSVWAQPTSARQGPDTGDGVIQPVHIPLARRGMAELQREDGSIDWTKTHSHVAKVQSKYLRTAQNLARRSSDSHVLNKRAPVVFVDDDGGSVPVPVPGLGLGKRAWDTNDGGASLELPIEERGWSDGVFDQNSWRLGTRKRSLPAQQQVQKRSSSSSSSSSRTIYKRSPTVELRDVVKNPKAVWNPKAHPSGAAAAPAVSTKAAAVKQAGVGLTPYPNAGVWTGSASIAGTTFSIDFDTGSADLWVPSVNCQSAGCAPHTKYDPSQSSTAVQVQGKQLSMRYGDGSMTSGDVYTDNVSVGGITAYNQTLGVALTLSSDWKDDPMDGMLGMGFQSISQLGVSPFFQTLMAQGAVSANQFSFKLSTGASELYLGGMNGNLYQSGSTSWYTLSSQSYWVISAGAYISGSLVSSLGTFSSIIDTGTSVIVAPAAQAQAFWASVPNSGSYGSGFYTYDCASPPVVSFSFNDADDEHWALSADSFNLGTVSSGSSRCVGAIIGADLGVSSWVLGDSFLKNVYATFDFDRNAVGFSTLQ